MKDKNDHLLADVNYILIRWENYSQSLNVNGVSESAWSQSFGG